MALRCSFCGTWNDKTSARCIDCGKPMGSLRAGWYRASRWLLGLAGVVLVGMTIVPVTRPFFDPRAVLALSSVMLFFAGLGLLLAGALRRP